MRRSLLTLACVAVALLLLPAAAQAITFNKAVDKLFRQGYPQRLEKKIAGFKSTPLGFRWTGSKADNDAADFLVAEMKKAGLTNVKLEKVPVDAWTIDSSTVTVGGKVMQASSYPGVPPTGPGGVTGQVVRIPNNATAADFDKAGDIKGKIAVVAFDSDDWWFNYPCAEAGLRGAKAVILVYDKRYPGYQGAPNAFASNDPGYTYTSPPVVWLPSDSATWLDKQMKKKTPVTAKVTLVSSHTLAEDGGFGNNVIGELPGTSADATKIILGGHHDSHFTGALDNDTACVAQLVIAKAMKMSGYKPASTIVFFNTTAEEWGYTDCNYDWLAGSVYSIQHTHPDWAGKVKAMLNMELLGYKDGSLWFTATRELKPWLEAEMKAHPKLVGPKGGKVLTPDQGYWFSYNDQWPLTATGIPSSCMWTPDEYFWTHYYHTNYDARNMIDWGFFKKNIKFNAGLAKSIDRKVLPYSLSTQSDALLKASTDLGFKAAGIDASTKAAYVDSVRSLASAAGKYDARRGRIKPAAVASTNTALLSIEKALNSNLTGLNVWDDTIYPFQQSMTDLEAMQAAVDALSKTPVAYKDAIDALGGVNCAWYGIYFSYDVYYTNLLQRQPGYVHANMADLGHMAMFVDVIKDRDAVIAAKDAKTVPADTIATLKAKIAAEQTDIEGRLQTLTTVLGGATAQIKAITPAAK